MAPIHQLEDPDFVHLFVDKFIIRRLRPAGALFLEHDQWEHGATIYRPNPPVNGRLKIVEASFLIINDL